MNGPVPINKSLRRRKRLPVSATLLLLALVASVVQYIQHGEVSWVTGSFRSVETTVKELVDSANADRLTENPGEYGAKTSQTVVKPGEEAQSATGLSNDSNNKRVPDSRGGIGGSVMGITDGDTIKVLDADHVLHKVRLTGIGVIVKSGVSALELGSDLINCFHLDSIFEFNPGNHLRQVAEAA